MTQAEYQKRVARMLRRQKCHNRKQALFVAITVLLMAGAIWIVMTQ